METLKNNTQSDNPGTRVVTGVSLSDAYRKVRQEFGPEAKISGSRTRTRRKSGGWGSEQVVEVVVESSPGRPNGNKAKIPAPENLTAAIEYEVDRLERMVEDILQPEGNQSASPQDRSGNPLGEFLIENGASHGAVERLLIRFAGETGLEPHDRPGAIAWLNNYLATGSELPAQISGKHAFLAENPGDRLETVFQLARCLTDTGRRTLVLAVLPDPDRDLPRLKIFAADVGCDAAILRETAQLDEMSGEFPGYDAVLIDLPALSHPAMAENGPVHLALAIDPDIHRHLQVPLERDFLDLVDLREAARSWNCDGLTLIRMGATRRPAKVLDLVDTIPLPISFLVTGSGSQAGLEAATPDRLLDFTLTRREGPGFAPGLAAENA